MIEVRKMDKNKMFESILSGRGMLLTGSGVNSNVKNNNGDIFPPG